MSHRCRRRPETGKPEYHCDLCHAWRPQIFMLATGRLLCTGCFHECRPQEIARRLRYQQGLSEVLRREHAAVMERIRLRRAESVR